MTQQEYDTALKLARWYLRRYHKLINKPDVYTPEDAVSDAFELMASDAVVNYDEKTLRRYISSVINKFEWRYVKSCKPKLYQERLAHAAACIKNGTEGLTDRYLRQLLKLNGVEVTSAAISSKRAQLQAKRQFGVQHGTTSMYRYGCRCAECRAAAREYNRKRAKQKAQEQLSNNIRLLLLMLKNGDKELDEVQRAMEQIIAWQLEGKY